MPELPAHLAVCCSSALTPWDQFPLQLPKAKQIKTEHKTKPTNTINLGGLEAIEIPSYVSSVWDFLAEHTAVFDPQMLPPCCVLRW